LVEVLGEEVAGAGIFVAEEWGDCGRGGGEK